MHGFTCTGSLPGSALFLSRDANCILLSVLLKCCVASPIRLWVLWGRSLSSSPQVLPQHLEECCVPGRPNKYLVNWTYISLISLEASSFVSAGCLLTHFGPVGEIYFSNKETCPNSKKLHGSKFSLFGLYTLSFRVKRRRSSALLSLVIVFCRDQEEKLWFKILI